MAANTFMQPASKFLVSYRTLAHIARHASQVPAQSLWPLVRSFLVTPHYARSVRGSTMSSGMSELQSFFASDSEYSEDEAQTSADLPRRVADAATFGDIDTIRSWLAAGGSPDAAMLRAPSRRSSHSWPTYAPRGRSSATRTRRARCGKSSVVAGGRLTRRFRAGPGSTSSSCRRSAPRAARRHLPPSRASSRPLRSRCTCRRKSSGGYCRTGARTATPE